jgi:hypothetical protein
MQRVEKTYWIRRIILLLTHCTAKTILEILSYGKSLHAESYSQNSCMNAQAID